jgi:hypothetical protein
MCSLAALSIAAAAAARIQIHPRYKSGEVLYYQIEMHTVSTGQTTTPIVNPESGTKSSENVDMLVRLDVLPDAQSRRQKSQQGGEAAGIRLRVTYERAHADLRTDAPELHAPSAAQLYDQLAGHSIEFTLEPNGAISNLQDADHVLSNFADAAAALSWTKLLASATAFPARGIAIGQSWTNDQPLAQAPLARLTWHTNSTYLRNEPCRAPSAAGEQQKAEGAAAQCAVILTQFKIVRRGSAHADQTPPDYVRHGLRTSGTLTGSGSSLDSFSLASGLLVNSTQTSAQRADYDIINAANGRKIHRAGQVQTQMVITRVSNPPALPPAKG